MKKSIYSLQIVILLLLTFSFFSQTNASTGNFSISPMPHSGEERTLFKYTLNPGDKITDFVAIVNKADVPQKVKLYTENFFFGLPIKQLISGPKPDQHDAEFLNIAESVYSLEPKGFIPVKFTINIPKETKIGNYTGQLFLENYETKTLNARVGKVFDITITEDPILSDFKKFQTQDWIKFARNPVINLQEKTIYVCSFLIFIILTVILFKYLKKEL